MASCVTKRDSLRSIVRLVVVFAVLASATTAAYGRTLDEGHQLIVERHRAAMLESSGGQLDTSRWHAEQMDDAGQWPDIEYEDGGRAGWPVYQHVVRLRTLALTLACEDEPVPDVQEALESGLSWWLDNDPQASNWWFNQIGTPTALMGMMTLAGDTLPDDLYDRSLEMMERAQLAGRNTTGQNAIWVLRVRLIRSALANDAETLTKTADRIAADVAIMAGEGVQADYSFHGHGTQLYSGGYGREYAGNTAEMAYLLHDTPYALSEEKLDLLVDYLVQGQQWMMHGRQFTYSAVGRGLTNRAAGQGNFIKPARTLAELRPDRAEELEAFIARMAGEGEPLVGHRHYWRSDLTTHHGPEHMFTVKAYSTRVQPTGHGNGQNLKSAHTDHGSTFLLRDGREYHDIFPVWDWKHVPGTTTAHDGELPVGAWSGPRGKTDFVGGVSDGKGGVTAFDFHFASSDEHTPLTARKAWFFFDDAIIALGTGIHGGGHYEVTTTLNQSHLRGTVTVSHEDGTQTLDAPDPTVHTWSEPSWVHHDGVGYVLLDDEQTLKLRAGEQQGTWKQINRNYDDDPIAHDVFRLWISHGKSPEAGAYSYAVLPDATAQSAAEFADANPARVLHNNTARQAVYHIEQNVLHVAFYEAGELASARTGSSMSWSTVSVDRPCLVTLRKAAEGDTLTVADPTHKLDQVTVTVNGQSKVVALPTELEAGKSVSIKLD